MIRLNLGEYPQREKVLVELKLGNTRKRVNSKDEPENLSILDFPGHQSWGSTLFFKINQEIRVISGD